MPTGAASRFAIRYGVLRGALDPQLVYDGLYAASTASFWLDSNQAGRFSFLGDDRGPLSETLIGRGGAVSVRNHRGVRAESGTIVSVLDTRLADRRIGRTCLPFEFVGGYVGYAGPAGVPGGDVGTSAAADRPPDAMWLFADRIVAVDHQAGLTYLLAVEDGRLGVRVAADAWIVDTMRRLHRLPSPATAAGPPPTLVAMDDQCPVDQVQDRYRRLRRNHPAPYAALLRFGEVELMSWASGSALRYEVRAAAAGSTDRLLAALATRDTSGPPAGSATCPDRLTRLGYLGLAGGFDLSLRTEVPGQAAVPRRPAVALVGAAEPAA